MTTKTSEALVSTKKSTTVRVEKRATELPFLRMSFGALAWAPPLAARLAERIFFAAPARRPVSSRHHALFARAQPLSLWVGARRVAAWSWGTGPTVLLAHGWAGHAAQLAAFVEPLLAAGHRVVAFDAPGHGASEGDRASVLDFAEAIHALAARTGPLAAVVAHSLGAAAAAYAIRQGLRVGRAVFLGPARDPSEWFERFLDRVGVDGDARPAMRATLEQRLHFHWRDLDAATVGARAATELLVVHDHDDAAVAWTDGAAIAAGWAGGRFVATRGLGHHAILRDPHTVARVAAFIARGEIDVVLDRCVHGRVDGACEHCALERELFDRSARWVAA